MQATISFPLLLCMLSILLAGLQMSYSFSLSTRTLSSRRVLRASTTDEPCAQQTKCPLAAKCSGEWREKGCSGDGKIQGGIATVLPWWPIKVFRPCPSYLEAGYVYRREGQTMDQVLFSEPSTKMKEKMKEMTDAEAARLKEARENRALVEGEETLSEEDKFLRDRFGNQ